MRRNDYSVEHIDEWRVILRDSGDGVTITNSAEAVLASLRATKQLRPRVFYYDSGGDPTELYHDGEGAFRGFGTPSSKELAVSG